MREVGRSYVIPCRVHDYSAQETSRGQPFAHDTGPFERCRCTATTVSGTAPNSTISDWGPEWKPGADTNWEAFDDEVRELCTGYCSGTAWDMPPHPSGAGVSASTSTGARTATTPRT